jgi:hypothetical protein
MVLLLFEPAFKAGAFAFPGPYQNKHDAFAHRLWIDRLSVQVAVKLADHAHGPFDGSDRMADMMARLLVMNEINGGSHVAPPNLRQ